QRGIARPEVVDDDADALRLQALDVRQRVLRAADEAVFRYFQLEPAGRKVDLRQEAQQALRQQRVLELDRGHVDGDLEMRWPVLRCQQRLVHDRERDFADQAAGFGDAQELCRLEQALGRMLPARQRLEAFHLAAGELVDRLEVGHELAGLDSVTDLRLERGLLAELYLHRLVELDPAVRARGLGLVHREVRPTQQPAQLARDALQAGDADRGADRDARVTRADRNLQRVDELVSQQPRLLSTGAQAV